MGEIVEFTGNGTSVRGYLAVPEGGDSGAGPGVVVIQEWWGMVDHIQRVCDRFAVEGFVALAPDLYHGETTVEPDEAAKMMMALDIDRAATEMAGAVAEVARRGNGRVGAIGFCMGGGLALVMGARAGDAVQAVAPFYGVIPWSDAQPDYSSMTAAVQGHWAADDHSAGPEAVQALESALRDAGVSVEMFTYAGTDHAFFNDDRPEVYDEAAAAQAWTRVLAFFRAELG